MRGRKPKPVELKLLAGTFRKDRAPAVKPQQRSGTPHAPEWFNDEELKEWKRLARYYRDQGRSIQPTEHGIHVSYVTLTVQRDETMRELRALERMVSERAAQLDIPGFEAALKMPEAWARRRDQLHRKLRQLIQEHKSVAAELGLTPSSRSRAGWGADLAPQPDDPWAKLAGDE